jgi:hypothetical protein
MDTLPPNNDTPPKKSSGQPSKIQGHLRTISRINIVFALVCCVAFVALYFWLRSLSTDTAQQAQNGTNAHTPASAQPVDTTEITEEYQEGVNEAVKGYAFDSAAKAPAVKEAVMKLRVPAELKTFHLELVVALDEAQQENYDSAQARFEKIKEEYRWFRP